MNKQYTIKESTRKRCKIIQLDDNTCKQFQPICMELFHYLNQAQIIDFSIYIKVGNEMIEYMKPTEFSKELLNHIWSAFA